jgi:hypothetical protein
MLKCLAVLIPARKVLDLILSPEMPWGFLWCWWLSHCSGFVLFKSLYSMMLTEHVVHTPLLNSCWINGFRFAWWLNTFQFWWDDNSLGWQQDTGLSNLREKRLTRDQVKIHVFCDVTLGHWVSSSWWFEGTAVLWSIGKYLLSDNVTSHKT